MSSVATAAPQPFQSAASSRAAAIFTRVPMIALSFVLTMIALRYLLHPIEAASAAGITFTSPGGITVARVGFAGFPLGFAAFFLSCLISQKRLLSGLNTELSLLTIMIGVRLISMATLHSLATAKLLAPEAVMAVLCVFAIRLELNRRRHQQMRFAV